MDGGTNFPNPTCWHTVYLAMLEVQESNGVPEKPPIPLILGGWWTSSDLEKEHRWRALYRWSLTHGAEQTLVEALQRGVDADHNENDFNALLSAAKRTPELRSGGINS